MSASASSGFLLTDVLQHYAQMGRTGRFEITGDEDFGSICLTVGVVTHSETSASKGVEAFFQILGWKKAPYKWIDGPGSTTVSMGDHVPDLLVQYIRKENERKTSTSELTPASIPLTQETRILQSQEGIGITLQISSPEISPYRIPLPSRQITLGRSPQNDICIPDSSLSRSHVILCISGDSILVRDLGSTNGTYIDDLRVNQGILHEGQTLKMGEVKCTFLLGTSSPKQTEISEKKES